MYTETCIGINKITVVNFYEYGIYFRSFINLSYYTAVNIFTCTCYYPNMAGQSCHKRKLIVIYFYIKHYITNI